VLTFAIDGPDHFDHELQPLPLATEFGHQARRERMTISRVHLLEELRPIGAERIGQHNPLRCQQPFDPVRVRRPRCDQPLALAVLTFGILFVGSWDANHAAHLPLASGVGHQDSNQGLCVETVGLGPACASADMNAGRIDYVVADPMLCQQSRRSIGNFVYGP
jgi:hypothetical protein